MSSKIVSLQNGTTNFEYWTTTSPTVLLHVFFMLFFFDTKYRLMDITPEPTAPKEIADFISNMTRWELEYYREWSHSITLTKMGKLCVGSVIQKMRGDASSIHAMTCLKMYNGHAMKFCEWWENMIEKLYAMAKQYEIYCYNNY